MNCLFEAVASVWVYGLRSVHRDALEDDLVASAREQLQEALARVSRQQGLYTEQARDLATEVRTRRSVLPRAELRKMLLKSRRLRAEQAKLDKKSEMMETQLGALETNEFNKSVISTLQTSARAMQKMGLGRDLQQTDQVISELEEGMQYSTDVTSALAGPLGQDGSVDDSELDAELDAILNGTEPPSLADPPAALPIAVSVNHMEEGSTKHAEEGDETEAIAEHPNEREQPAVAV